MPQLTPKPTAATTPAAESKKKRERVATITIKWAIFRVRSELQLSSINNANNLLKQVDNGMVVKILIDQLT
jgi:hypothetical protein